MDFHYGRWTQVLAVVMVQATIIPYARSETFSIQKLQKKIVENKAEWQAGKTWLTDLDRASLKQMMNAPSDELDQKIQFEVQSRRQEPEVERAQKFDWRNIKNSNYVSPIRNQGICGSCVAFAMAGALEIQNNIASGVPGMNSTLSAEALFACGGASCKGSLGPDTAIKFLKSQGVPDEACAPHQMGATGQEMSCSSICSDSDSRSLKLSDYSRPSNGSAHYDINAVKEAVKRGPLVSLMRIYSDVLAYKGGVYRHVSDDFVGAHAVVIVGFDDTKKAWIIKNSWGTLWGDNGFGYIAYDDLDTAVGMATWSMDLPGNQERTYVISPKLGSTVTGVVSFKVGTNVGDARSIRTKIYSSQTNQLIQSLECRVDAASKKCESQMNVTQLSEGRYYLLAETDTQNGVNKSSVEYFHVLNVKPSIKIEWKQKPKAAKDFLAFAVSFKGSQVPLTGLTLNVKNPQDGSSYARYTDVIANNMIVKLRTASIEPGRYDLQLTGVLETSKTKYTFNSDTLSMQIDHAK